MKDTIIATLIGVGFMFFIFFVLTHGTTNSEVSQCKILQQDAEKYPNFYITSWQAQMCEAQEITINAEIR